VIKLYARDVFVDANLVASRASMAIAECTDLPLVLIFVAARQVPDRPWIQWERMLGSPKPAHTTEATT